MPATNMTRQQRYLSQALDHVSAVKGKGKEVADIYGGLCHKFPILVRTGGLCQALAFVQEKSNSDSEGARSQAHTLLLNHVTDALQPSGGKNVLDHVRTIDVTEYMWCTRTVLGAWIYYKRFASSILGVESAEAADAEKGGDGA